MKNKIIALILVLALVLPFETAFALISTDKVPEFLEAIEIIPSVASATDETITRGEFVKLAAKLVTINNYKNLADPCKFLDVTEEDDFYDEVNLLQQMGVIHGETDTEFRPNDPIELNHACKILIHIMGYEHFATNGSYLVIADQKGLLSGISVEGETFSRKTALKLIYNVLEADISDYNSIDGNSSNEYHEAFMTKRLGIYKIKAAVTDDGVLALTGESKVKDGQIVAGGQVFRNETGLKDLLGYTIEGFYKKDIETEEDVLVFAFVRDAESSILKLTGDEVAQYANLTYEYYTDEYQYDTDEVYVDPSYKLVYNGRLFKAEEALPGFALTVDQMMNPAIGEIKLTDIDADGDYDIVSIIDLKSYIVNSIDYSEYKIYGKPGITPGTVDFSAVKDSLNIKSPNGDIVSDFSKILADDVVSVGFSADGKHAEIIIANEKGSGMIQSSDAEGYVINDKEYKFAPEFVTYMQTVDIPEAGVNVDFYLTYEGKIIYAKNASETGILYARITGLTGKLDALEPQLSVQLYLENNSYDYYNFAKTVTIDGVKYQNQLEDIFNYLFVANDFSATGEYYGIVLVKLNADDEIYFMDTPYKESEGNPNTSTEGDDTLHVIKNGEKKVARYIHNSFSFQGNWAANIDSKFIVVADKSDNPEEDMLMTSITTTDASNINNTLSEMMAFSTKANSFIADAVVRIVERYKGAIAQNGEYQILLKVTDALNKEGEPVKKVTVTNGKVIKDYYTQSEDSLVCKCGSTYCEATPLVAAPGDIVKFTLTDGVVADGGMFVAYDYSEDEQWAYVSEVKHIDTAGAPTKQNNYGSYYTRYALLSGYMNVLDFETAQWVIDYLPYRVSETYRENSVNYGPFSDYPVVYSMTNAYTISVNVNKGTIKPKLTGEIKQYNDGLGVMKKYFLLMNNGAPYCVVEYEN